MIFTSLEKSPRMGSRKDWGKAILLALKIKFPHFLISIGLGMLLVFYALPLVDRLFSEQPIYYPLPRWLWKDAFVMVSAPSPPSEAVPTYTAPMCPTEHERSGSRVLWYQKNMVRLVATNRPFSLFIFGVISIIVGQLIIILTRLGKE